MLPYLDSRLRVKLASFPSLRAVSALDTASKGKKALNEVNSIDCHVTRHRDRCHARPAHQPPQAVTQDRSCPSPRAGQSRLYSLMHLASQTSRCITPSDLTALRPSRAAFTSSRPTLSALRIRRCHPSLFTSWRPARSAAVAGSMQHYRNFSQASQQQRSPHATQARRGPGT